MFKIWFEWDPPEVALKLLEGRATVLGPASRTPHQPWIDLPDAEAIIAAADLKYTDAILALAPHLQVLSRIGVGCDNVDIAAATNRGIPVCNAPNAPTTSTAEHAIALLLAVAKQIPQLQVRLQRGELANYFLENRGLELSGRTLGVVGFGRVGQRVACLARGLDMEVVAYDPHANDDSFLNCGAARCKTLDELLKIADVVSLHLPLTEKSRGLVDRKILERMKSGSILINTARGGLVDEVALCELLNSGHLFGAGLDVFESEPVARDNPLLSCDRVVATPHVASATDVSRLQLWSIAVEQALDVLSGRMPAHLVNPGVIH